MSIQLQVHEKFKVFVGSDVAEIDAQVRALTAAGKIAAKSIGVEHVAGGGRLLLSLVYRADEAGYPVKLESKTLGALDPASTESIAALESALEAASDGSDKVICHGLYVAAGSVNALLLVLA